MSKTSEKPAVTYRKNDKPDELRRFFERVRRGVQRVMPNTTPQEQAQMIRRGVSVAIPLPDDDD